MKKSFDRVADIYDDTRQMPPDAVTGIMENIIGEVDPLGGMVLDLGVGTGRIAVPLAERGFHVVGVDIAEKMFSYLQEKMATVPGRIRAVYADISALPFADNSFTAAIAVHVFHLLDDINACISESRRILSPNGCLLFGGEQRLLRYVERILREKYGMKDDLIRMFVEAGIRLPDQTDIERKVAQSVRSIGSDFTHLPPVEWDYEITCAAIMDRIEGRIASYLWNVPEGAMKKLVENLRDILATRVGSPSTVIRFRRRFDMFCSRFQ